jgi:hypothetical protein
VQAAFAVRLHVGQAVQFGSRQPRSTQTLAEYAWAGRAGTRQHARSEASPECNMVPAWGEEGGD